MALSPVVPATFATRGRGNTFWVEKHRVFAPVAQQYANLEHFWFEMVTRR